MILHGIERVPRDLDVFCATQTWFSLYTSAHSGSARDVEWNLFTTDPDDSKRRCDPPYLYRTIDGLEVNVFHDWRKRGIGEINVAFWIHNAVERAGWPCIPLDFLLTWKEEVGREKDVKDIELIRSFLRSRGVR